VLYLVEEMLAARKGLFTTYPSLRPLGEAFVAVFPDLQVFNASQNLLLGMPIAGSYVLSAFGYAIAYVTFFLGIAVLLFQRRDFI
jgi:ABC-type transport system involved in multi-copper enzyme maturation permease subunit